MSSKIIAKWEHQFITQIILTWRLLQFAKVPDRQTMDLRSIILRLLSCTILWITWSTCCVWLNAVCYWSVRILIVRGEPATRDMKLEKQNVLSADSYQHVLGWAPQLLMIFCWPSLCDCISSAEVWPLFFGSLNCRAKEKEIEGKPMYCECLLELTDILILSSLFLLLLLANS